MLEWLADTPDKKWSLDHVDFVSSVSGGVNCKAVVVTAAWNECVWWCRWVRVRGLAEPILCNRRSDTVRHCQQSSKQGYTKPTICGPIFLTECAARAPAELNLSRCMVTRLTHSNPRFELFDRFTAMQYLTFYQYMIIYRSSVYILW